MHDPLKLENQLCFSLYSGARSIVRKYKPFLDPLNLTYTQYICLLVLDDERMISIELSEKGLALKDAAKDIPFKIASCLNIDLKQAVQLKQTLDLLIDKNPK
jgi:hypothetical protein